MFLFTVLLLSATGMACTGASWEDSSGDVWYTRDGWLCRNGEPVLHGVSAHHVSVESGRAAFTDSSDLLHVLDIGSGSETVVGGYRFFAPVVTVSGDVISSTLSSRIVMVDEDDSVTVLATGDQPFWSQDHQGVFYIVSSDDGHVITDADVWFVKPEGEPLRITWTGDVHETAPEVSGNDLLYTDALTGLSGSISLHDLDL